MFWKKTHTKQVLEISTCILLSFCDKEQSLQVYITCLQVAYCLLMPSQDPMAEEAFEFQVWVVSIYLVASNLCPTLAL